MDIFLIRHGESTSDVKQKYDGDYDDHLTESGRTDAELVGQALKDQSIDHIFASPKIRAQETAEIMTPYLGVETTTLPDLAEQDIYAAFLELGKDQPEEEYRKLGEVLADRENTYNGSEAYQDFRTRCLRAFETISTSDYQRVAVITHGGPIRCFFREHIGTELASIGNGAIIHLSYQDGHYAIQNMHKATLQD